MLERELPKSGGEAFFDALDVILDLPDLESQEAGTFAYSVPPHKITDIFLMCSNGPLATLVPKPNQLLAEVFVNSWVPRLDKMRVKETPDFIGVKINPSVSWPWVYLTLGYIYEFDAPNIGQHEIRIGVGVQLTGSNRVLAGREVALNSNVPGLELLIKDRRYQAEASSAAFMLSIAEELARSGNSN